MVMDNIKTMFSSFHDCGQARKKQTNCFARALTGTLMYFCCMTFAIRILDTSAPPPVYAPAGFGAPGEGSLMRPPDSENLFNRDHVGIEGVLNEKNRTKKRPILQ
jgi:hypothetical protein